MCCAENNGQRHLPRGPLHLDIQIGGKKTRANFLVVDDAPLLSGEICEDLELLTVKRELLVNTVSDVKTLTREAVLSDYKDVFTGLGYIGNYKIELKEEAIPKQDPPRTVPIALRDDVKKALQDM